MKYSFAKIWGRLALSGCLVVALSAPFGVAFADLTTYESFIEAEASKIEIVGANAGEQLGAAITAGDFNGDGIEDLALGAPFASITPKEWNGAVYVIFGDTNKTAGKTIDLSYMEPDLVFFGEYSGDALGSSLTSGDFNNDGVDDLAIGAYNAYFKNIRPGKVYVVNGRKNWEEKAFNFQSQLADTLFIGHSDGDEFGLSIKALDVNNDKYEDLVIGAPSASTPDVEKSGNVYAYFGARRGFKNKTYDLQERLPDKVFYGHETGERFGATVDGGKVASQKRGTLIISAYKASVGNLKEAGKVYFYTNELSTVIEGVEEYDWFGFDLDTGSLNKDQLEDVAVSSLGLKKNYNSSKISIFYGNDLFAKQGAVMADNDQFRGILVDDPVDQNRLGTSIMLEDMNSDGKAEIIAGAPGIGKPVSQSGGDVYLVYSSEGGFETNYSVKKQHLSSTLHGAKPDDWFGYDLETLDFNNDGAKDLAISSRYSDSDLGNDTGKVFVLMGNKNPFGIEKTVLAPQENTVSRGELIKEVIRSFDLKNEKSALISSCYEHVDYCFYNFTAMSNFDELALKPEIVLYPDVRPGSKYYEDVTIGTMLGLIEGYMAQDESPFYPEEPISRIQALKIVLSATELVKPKYRFQLAEELGGVDKLSQQESFFKDINSKISGMWWYPRYANFAAENGIVNTAEKFRPDDNIKVGELQSIIKRTVEFLNKQNEKVNS